MAARREGPQKGRWLGGLVVVTACSWLRFAATGSPKVDENAPSALVGTLLFFGLLAGYALMVDAWRRFLVDPPAEPRRLAYAGLFVASLMLPMITNDVFSLFVYGSVAATGRDLYTTAQWLPTSPYYGLMGQMWNQTVCVYGPTTLIATIPAWLGRGHPMVALFALRTIWLLPTVLVMEASLRTLKDRPFFHTMVWLNPLWLMEGPGQLHTDMLGLLALTAGIVLQLRRRVAGIPLAWLSFAVAAVGKYSFLFAGPWFWLQGARSWQQRGARLPGLALALAAVAVPAFGLFWNGTRTLTEPIAALGRMNPGGSIVEVVGQVIFVLTGGTPASPSMPAKMAVAYEHATKAGIWTVLSTITRVVALAVGVRALLSMLGVNSPAGSPRPSDGPVDDAADRRIAVGTGIIVVAALTLASHRFQSRRPGADGGSPSSGWPSP
jgi:hypothetical protein